MADARHDPVSLAIQRNRIVTAFRNSQAWALASRFEALDCPIR